jgi:hypothetical protein
MRQYIYIVFVSSRQCLYQWWKKEDEMKNLTKVSVVTATSFAAMFTFNALAAMDPYMETALVDSCKAAMSNKVLKLNRTLKEYRLKDKTVALKVVCNGDNIIAFAQKYGADKTAAKLSNSIGQASIQDIASTQNTWSVNFAVK